jgi:hypothetical protein
MIATSYVPEFVTESLITGLVTSPTSMLIDFVVFNVTTKIGVNWFYQYHSSIFFKSSSG